MADVFSPIVLATAAEVAERAAAIIAEEVVRAAAASATLSLMLAGGTTPRAAYERLATMPLPFSTIRFFFGDERAVAPDHPESNHRMAKEALFDRAGIDPKHVHRMAAEAPDREGAARAYAALLPERIDVLLLGMGEDAHTASLFPGSEAIEERELRVKPVTGPKPPPDRLTITPVVIERARRVVVLVTGSGKAEALERAAKGPLDPRRYPIQLARGGEIYADPPAAHRL